jgi:hypothetical protein
MMFSGRHFALSDFFAGTPDPTRFHPQLDEGRLRRYLKRCPRGMFVTSHARFHPDLQHLIEELGFKHILLLRDPRDVAVSHAFYMMQDTLHQHHEYYTKTLKSDEERLMASIRGFEDGAGNHMTSIGETFGAYLPWMDLPSTVVVRFEDMIGPHGGGDAEKQLGQIQRTGEFVGRPVDRKGAQRIAQKMYGNGSLTFRKGQAGDWRNHFTEAHKRAFQEVAGDLLIRLGYEGADGR